MSAKSGRTVLSVTRRTFFSSAATFAFVPPALGQSSRSELVAYQTFSKKQLQLRPFVGRNVVLLLAPERQPAQIVIDRVLSAADRGWDWYKDMFGRAPTPSSMHEGKATIAEVPDTCGAGCGLMGFTGIEMLPKYADLMLDQAVHDRYNQLMFYEFGRNFFFFREPLGRLDAFITGFAHVNRFYCMDAIGVHWRALG
jgi:hypothetical protein